MSRYFPILFLLFIGLTDAWHNHGDHLDINFVHTEAARIAYNSKNVIVEDINNYIDMVRHLEEKHHVLFEQDRVKASEMPKIEKTWKEIYLPEYKELQDRLILLTAVCNDIFDFPTECTLPDNIWNQKIDGRGMQFRIEFE
jgi:hypothetical protein